MEFLSQLRLPIVVSALLVWITSAITHMVLPHHKGDFKRLPNEAEVLQTLKDVPADQYMFPFCTMEEMKTPEFIAKQKGGPNGVMTIWPGPVNMGRNLMMTFAFYLLVGFFVAYLSWHAMGANVPYLTVFRIAGVAAFMAHGLGWMANMIWFGGKGFWGYVFDSLLYALVTAGAFGWLWPR